MIILDNITATAGQIVKELEDLVKYNPLAIPTFGFYDQYITDVRMLTDDIALFESGTDEDYAIQPTIILDELQAMSPDTKVVIQYDGWQIRNLLPDNGFIFNCDEGDEYINLLCSDNDVRLRGWNVLYSEMSRIAESNPDGRIACLGDKGEILFVCDIFEDDCEGSVIMAVDSSGESDCITVTKFLEEFYTKSLKWGVCVRCRFEGEENLLLRSLKIGEDGSVFSKYELDGEDIVVFRAGEPICNPKDGELMADGCRDDDDDYYDDDDDYDEELDDYYDDDDNDDAERKYIFRYDVTTTVRDLTKELVNIVRDDPDGYLTFSDAVNSDIVISGIQLWKGFVFLRASWEDDDAMPVRALLSELEKQDPDSGVLLRSTWEIKNLKFWDNDSRYIGDYLSIDTEQNDIRLFTVFDLKNDMRRFAEKCPDRKLLCKTADGLFHEIYELFSNDGLNCISIRGDKNDGGVTVSEFMDSFYYTEGGVVVGFKPGRKFTYRAIETVDGKVFFEDTFCGEDVIAFNLGQMLFDPNVEDDYADDFFTEDDIVVKKSGNEKQPIEFVDLGLSVKWAKCNIGAMKPEEFGDYFSWGETEPKSNYEIECYKHCAATFLETTKYNTKENYGKSVDGKKTLEPEDDAAFVKLGDGWRMPTSKEYDELMNPANCSRSKMTLNGIKGYKIQSKIPGFKDNWIFFPAAGYMSGDTLRGKDWGCVYWSSSLWTRSPQEAQAMFLRDGLYSIENRTRSYGLSIRAVTK